MNMNREELIEEAAKAIYDEGPRIWSPESVTRYAQLALAVFEQAHVQELATSPERVKNGSDSSHVAPTDEEREAAIEEVAAAFQQHEGAPTWKDDPVARDAALRWHMRGFKDGLNARRTVQGEPDSDCSCQQVQECYDDGSWARSYVTHPDPECVVHRVQCEPTEHFHIWSELPCKPGECRMEPRVEPTDDERDARYVTDADLDRFEATAEPIYRSTVEAAKVSKYLVSDLGQWIIRLVAEVRRLRAAEESDERIDAWHMVADHEAFKSCYDQEQPLIDSVLDRITAMHEAESTINELAPAREWAIRTVQGEPTDAQVEAGCVAFYEHASGLTSWARLVEYDTVLADRYRDGIRRALRAAAAVREEGQGHG